MLWLLRFLGAGVRCFDGIDGKYRQREQFAGTSDVLGALAAGEQAIVADAMEACGQHVHEKAADELVGREGHHLVSLAPFAPVVLPLEGDALVIACDQAAIGDGDAMGVAREISQDFLRAAEGAFAVDHPVCVPQRRQIGGECSQVYEDTGIRTAPLRGIGFTANKFATETFVDEIAYKRGFDPVKYRLELLAKTPRAHKVMERAAQMEDWGRKRDDHGLGASYIDYSDTQVAAVVEISVDRSTGKIKFHNVWCVIDCGVAVQPDNVVAQTESSIVYGIGLALTERISIKNGEVEQSNFYDYVVSRNSDVPPMHVEVIQTDNPPTGVGQMATPLITPAVSNAMMALTGVRLRHAPFTEERVKKALG